MTRRELLRLAVAAAASRALPLDGNAPAEVPRRILRLGSGSVEEIPLERYVAAVLPAEMGFALPAALEAQAVAVRSYALGETDRHAAEGADLCDGTHCQVYRGQGSATAASRRAAEATRGMVLVQKGHVIAAPFHAVCGGRTARPRDVWDDEETPDLEPVEDDACLEAPGARWGFRLARRDVPALAAALGFPEGRFFEVYGMSDERRVGSVRFVAPGGMAFLVRGFDFRKAALALWGWASVRSTAFTLEETRAEYILSGRGTGHGAGLCQAGTMTRARRGQTREAILMHYYRGASLAELPA